MGPRMIAWLTLALGCGGGRAALPPPVVGEPIAVPESPTEASAIGGSITRDQLLPVLDAGLGRFLAGVETEPALEDGRFAGFRLVSLYPGDPRFAEVDLGPGDVIVRVNRQSIERPEHAFQVWDSLRVASELNIEYVRAGELQELRYVIRD